MKFNWYYICPDLSIEPYEDVVDSPNINSKGSSYFSSYKRAKEEVERRIFERLKEYKQETTRLKIILEELKDDSEH